MNTQIDSLEHLFQMPEDEVMDGEALILNLHSYLEKIDDNYDYNKYDVNDEFVVNSYEGIEINSLDSETQKALKFGVIEGNFVVNDSKLSSFENFPESISGDFICENCNVTSLEGMPFDIGGSIKIASKYLEASIADFRDIEFSRLYLSNVENTLIDQDKIPSELYYLIERDETDGNPYLSRRAFNVVYSKMYAINLD